jgi:hypothetical protein
MQKMIKIPRIYKVKFLDALGDAYMSTISDQEKIEYANRKMRHEYILNKDLYEHFSLRQELEKNVPSLVSDWDNVVKNNGVII